MVGIVSYHYLGQFFHIPWYWPLLLFLLFVVLVKRASHKHHQLLSVMAMVMLFMFGVLRLQSYRLDNDPAHLLHIDQEIEAYEAIIIEEPTPKSRSVNVRLELKRAKVGGGWQPTSGRVNGYVAKSDSFSLGYGDRILVKGNPQQTEAPKNPGEFDFAGYLVYNNIFHQQFIGEDYAVVGHEEPNWFVGHSIHLRQRCRSLLMAHITDPEVRSVMLALVLGIKDELDPELQSAFSASGAMHVLAVSGLHVGIIYMIVLLFFKLLKVDEHRMRWLIAISSVVVLWLYAFVTGLSPSVLRAVTMFSFVAIAKAMNRNSNIYNTLAASAFVLLWFNPYLLMSVGFQLSYLAVFGIVYLQPRFYNLIPVRHWLLDKVWAITCVSLAAQIATAPMSVLYFHQFPSYFLISNLFIIPSAFVMLLMGLVMLVVSSIPWLGEGLGWLIEFFVSIVNDLVYWVQGLPGSTLNGIRITTGETWLVYTVIIMCILLFRRKKLHYLMAGFCIACLFSTTQGTHQRDQLESGSFRILNVSNASVVDFRFGSHAQLLSDSSFLADQNRRRFHFEPGRLQSGASLDPGKEVLPLAESSFMGNRLVCFKGETFLIYSQKLQIDSLARPLKVDHLILSNSSVKNLDEVSRFFDFEQLLIDSSYKGYLAKRLLNQAKALDLKVHAIRQDGYFEKLWQK